MDINKEQIDVLRTKANDQIELIFEKLGINNSNSYGYSDEIRGCCPVHGGDNPTAFCYSLKYKSWRCFTNNCHKIGWDILGLITAILSKDNPQFSFNDAIKWLKDILNLEKIEAIAPNVIDLALKEARQYKKPGNSYKEYFKPFPLSTIKDKVVPSEYFIKQGFSKEILKKYYVGFCNNPNKPMYLRSYTPIIDDNNINVVGISGRIIYDQCSICGKFHDPNSHGCPEDNIKVRDYPKWMHYGFSSKNVLYNFNYAKDFIKKLNQAIIVEGPKDVWWLEQHGINNAVCIFGLSLTTEHIKKLVGIGTLRVVIGTDNDTRGKEAKEQIARKISNYFKIINSDKIFQKEKDIAEISTDRMISEVTPYLKSIGN